MKKVFTLLLGMFFIVSVWGQQSFPLKNNDKESFISELTIYPNPTTSGDISIQFRVDLKQEKLTIKVYNLIGNEVYAKEQSEYDDQYQETISLGAYPKGIYILEVSNGEKKEIRRLSYV